MLSRATRFSAAAAAAGPARALGALAGDAAVGVTNTLHRFMHCLDTGDVDTFCTLFVKDTGSCEVVKAGQTFRGEVQLADLCSGIFHKFEGAHHWEGNVVLAAGERPGTATNVSYWQAVLDGRIISYGLHEDELELGEDGVWRFARRVVRHQWARASNAA